MISLWSASITRLTLLAAMASAGIGALPLPAAAYYCHTTGNTSVLVDCTTKGVRIYALPRSGYIYYKVINVNFVSVSGQRNCMMKEPYLPNGYKNSGDCLIAQTSLNRSGHEAFVYRCNVSSGACAFIKRTFKW
jgi:hypothetical protein